LTGFPSPNKVLVSFSSCAMMWFCHDENKKSKETKRIHLFIVCVIKWFIKNFIKNETCNLEIACKEGVLHQKIVIFNTFDKKRV